MGNLLKSVLHAAIIQVSLLKGQEKNKWKSLSGEPHLQQASEMSSILWLSLIVEGRAYLRSLQAKTLTLGGILLSFQTALIKAIHVKGDSPVDGERPEHEHAQHLVEVGEH